MTIKGKHTHQKIRDKTSDLQCLCRKFRRIYKKATRIEFRKFSRYKVNIQKVKCIFILGNKKLETEIFKHTLYNSTKIHEINLRKHVKGLCAENYKNADEGNQKDNKK